ncbi:hypothetical protein ACRS6B_04810 [Nocardia asteroides]
MGIALVVAVSVLSAVALRSGHRMRNVVNGVRGAHSARARRRRALRTRGAGIAGAPRTAPAGQRVRAA